jgi:RNA polymerase sigma-70 factor (ECF subfamily)
LGTQSKKVVFSQLRIALLLSKFVLSIRGLNHLSPPVVLCLNPLSEMTDPHPSPTLEQLAAAAQKNDLAAFQKLVRRIQSKAFSLTFRLLADEDDARDAAQESFIRLWQNLHRYDPAQRFETWFYRIVTNIALDRLRARKRWLRVFERKEDLRGDFPDGLNVEGTMSNNELACIIRALTEELPPKQRAVLVLRDFQDLSTEEVAQVTRMSEESVKTNLHYARTRVRGLLKKRVGISSEDL